MIVPKRTTIGDLYNLNARLQVPRYQRRYDWGKSELLDMMTDLREAMVSDTPMFLGNFVFDTSGRDDSGREIFSIVDGQQRITSLTLLLIACREHSKKLGNDGLAQEIQKKISFTDATTGRMENERVLTSPSVREVFNYICEKDWKRDFPAKLDGQAVKRQSNKLKPLYDFMSGALDDFDNDDLSRFLKAVYSSYVIQVDIESEIEAFDIFERMNARGLSLNVADLVKNYLFANLSDLNIESQWDEITRNAGGTLQRMLKYFWVSQNGHITQKELYRRLKTLGNQHGPEQLTQGLARFSEYYVAIQSDDEKHIKNWLKSDGCSAIAENSGYFADFISASQGLNLFKIRQHFPLIYSIVKAYERSDRSDKDTQILLRLMRNLESYHFINNQICDRIGNEVEKAYADFAKEFGSTSNFRSVASDFVTKVLIAKRAPKSEFVTRFSELEYSSSSLTVADTCYIFDRIENRARYNNIVLKPTEWTRLYDPDPDTLKKGFNTEHFLPQRPNYDVPKEDMDVVNNIGNLFVISRHTNSYLQNKAPIEKAPMLLERAKHLRYIVDFIGQFEASGRKWGRQEINFRAANLALRAYDEVWVIAPC